MTFLTAGAALSAHQTKIADIAADIDATRKPVLEVEDRVCAAKAALRSAEAERSDIGESESLAIVSDRDSPRTDFTKAICKADAEVARLHRVICALENKRDDLTRPLSDLLLTKALEKSRTDVLVADAVAEIADGQIEAMRTAQAAAAKAEAAARTLVAHITDRKWFVLTERLNRKLRTAPPRWGDQRFPDWPGYVTALANDASATVPVAS